MTFRLRNLTLPVAGLALAGALVAPSAALASQEVEPVDPAAPVEQERPGDLEAARERCLAGIDKRTEALDQAATRIADAEHLTDDHEATLTGIVDQTVAGLSELRAGVEVAPDVEALKPQCEAVVYEHRVFVLRLPQVHVTIGADTGLHVVDTFGEISARLEEAIVRAQDAGLDVQNATELLAEADAASQAAADALSGSADAVLALTPADVNSGGAEAVVEAVRADLELAKSELALARDNGRAIVEILRGLDAP